MSTRRSFIQTFVALLLLALVSACGVKPTVFPSPVPSPKRNQVATKAGFPDGVHTLTPFLKTPSPTYTLFQNSTPTLDTVKVATANAASTQRAQYVQRSKTEVAVFPSTCENSYGEYYSISPGGVWLASICGSNRQQTLVIVNRRGKRFLLQFKDYILKEDLHEGNAPMGRLYPAQWINDDYLFFSSNIHVSGGGTCFYGFGREALHRIDLSNGVVSVVLSPRPVTTGYLYAFSPGGRRLVYKQNQETIILDLRTGDKNLLNYSEGAIGSFTWSPDGKKLAFATCKATEDWYWIENSTVQIYDVETGEYQTAFKIEGNHQLFVDS